MPPHPRPAAQPTTQPVAQPAAAARVAVVGAGIAGAACARALSAAGPRVEVTVLDRGRAVGGRLASRQLHGRPVDLGASYLTARDPRFVAQVQDWTARGIARPWTDAFAALTPDGAGEVKRGPVRYGAPRGLRSLVEDLLSPLGGAVRTDTQVASVAPGPTVDGERYDAVVLAMPDPQALGVLDGRLAAERTALADRAWEPVLALAAGFAKRGWDVDGCFVNGSDVLSWVADDGSRRGDGAPVLVAHSTPSYAGQHLAEPQAAGPAMVAALRALLGLPEPVWTYVQRWSYAKPVGTRDAPWFLGPARVGLCGDGWGESKVEAAWLSGTGLGQALLDRLAQRGGSSSER